MNILFVLPSLPYPAHSGGHIRLLSLIKELSRTDAIDLICLQAHPTPSEHLAGLDPFCRRIILCNHPRRRRTHQLGRVALRTLRGIPFYTKYIDSDVMRRALLEHTTSEHYDVILVEHTHMAEYLQSLHPKHGARTILELQNVETTQFERMYRTARTPYQRLQYWLTWWPMRRWEPRMAAMFDHIITVSEADRSLLLSRNPALNITTVSNGIDVDRCKPAGGEPRQPRIVYVGSMGYEPNVDAALYLHDDIYPLIRKQCPTCALQIVGQSPPDAIRRLNRSDGVSVHADVPDVAPYYHHASAAVIPLRAGGGTRLKILEAMAFGTPVVSTSIGCEGLDVTDGVHLLVADTTEQLAAHTAQLLTDRDLWLRLARNGRQLVEQNYSWKRIAGHFRQACGPTNTEVRTKNDLQREQKP